jgi:hypothetical protein
MSLTAVEQLAVERLEQGIEERTVIPVIGAGVSCQSANLPTWNGLLRDALTWTESKREMLGIPDSELKALRGRLRLDDPSLACYEAWADAVFSRNSGGAHWLAPSYREWLESTFGIPEAHDPRLYKALRDIGSRVIVTTNYDKLLSYELMPDGQIVTWDNEDTIRSLLRDGRGVLHLHGTFDEPESIVLTSSDYTRIAERELRSAVSQSLTSHSILLFIGISPAGATDRHLARLLRAGMRSRANDAPQRSRAHVLLHKGALSSQQASSLKALDIEPVCFGSTYAELAPFLERLGERRAAIQFATELVGLDLAGGKALSESRWAPEDCLNRVQDSLRFMGLRSSKWVSDEQTIQTLDRVLGVLDGRGEASVRFLVLNPECAAYQRLEGMRGEKLPVDHLAQLARLEKRHRSLRIRCIDFISAFRFTAVNNEEIGLALYPTDPTEFHETLGGWTARHYSLHTRQRWSLARSLLFTFDEHFTNAAPLRDVMPRLFA